MAIPVRTVARSPGAERRTASSAWRSSPASPGWARAGRRAPGRGAGRERHERHAGAAVRAVTAKGAKRAATAAGRGRVTRTPSAVSSRSSSAVDVVQLGQPPALVVGQEQVDLAQGLGQRGVDALERAPRCPSPVAAEICTASRVAAGRARARASSSSASILLSTRIRGRSPAPISSSTSSTARIIPSLVLGAAEASTTWRTSVGAPGLLERRAEGVDELMGQLADEPDGVGDEHLAPGDPRSRASSGRGCGRAGRARRRSRRSARSSSVDLPALVYPARATVRQVRALALAALEVARVPDWSRRRLSAAMRSRARRRSVSIWVSPGPRVPMPPPMRSRWVHSPRMRARLYSSWASSTWSLPSAVWAWSAKMSRITAVRSTTGVSPSACSRLRSWRGVSSSSQTTTLASPCLSARLELLELALADVGVGVRPVAVLDRAHRPGRRRRCPAARAARRDRRPRAGRRAAGRAAWRGRWAASAPFPV